MPKLIPADKVNQRIVVPAANEGLRLSAKTPKAPRALQILGGTSRFTIGIENLG
jgi:hypothetical protein